jgi:hypothetical protein
MKRHGKKDAPGTPMPRRRLHDAWERRLEAMVALEEFSVEVQEAPTLQREFVLAVIRSGVDRAYAYAWTRSGYFITERNVALIPSVARQRWDRAIREWRQMSMLERATTLQALLSTHPN